MADGVIQLVLDTPDLHSECSTSCPRLIAEKLAEGFLPKTAEDKRKIEELGHDGQAH